MPLTDPTSGIEYVQLTLISMCDLICQISLSMLMVESGNFEGERHVGTMLKEVRILTTRTDYQKNRCIRVIRIVCMQTTTDFDIENFFVENV